MALAYDERACLSLARSGVCAHGSDCLYVASHHWPLTKLKARATCKFGNKCRDVDACIFVHEGHDMSEALRGIQITPAVLQPRVGASHSTTQPSRDPSVLGRKTRLCNYYEQGRCDAGSSCSFAHGRHELRGYDGRPVASNASKCALSLLEPR